MKKKMEIDEKKIQAFDKVKDELFPEYESIQELIEKVINGSNLFGTIVIDTYRRDEVREIYNAIDIVANRKGMFSFDHYGIYCYWNYYTKEILYIGLSKNLRTRFGQHNGIITSKNTGTKYEKIQAYFDENERIGFTILLQSPFEHKDITFYSKEEEIKIIEGSLIESFLLENGNMPRWNEVGGSVSGRKQRSVSRYGDILKMITGEEVGFLNSKSTLREIANNEEYLSLESDLNLIRSRMYKYNESFETAIDRIFKWNAFLMSQGEIGAFFSDYRLLKMMENDYFDKKIVIQ